jgi:hypothetical protein
MGPLSASEQVEPDAHEAVHVPPGERHRAHVAGCSRGQEPEIRNRDLKRRGRPIDRELDRVNLQEVHRHLHLAPAGLDHLGPIDFDALRTACKCRIGAVRAVVRDQGDGLRERHIEREGFIDLVALDLELPENLPVYYRTGRTGLLQTGLLP